MQRIWIYLFLLIGLNANAQNLVPNWSFEDTVSCPFGVTQIDRATGWSSYKLTPDYFNSCSNGQPSVPANLFGYQSAKTGNAYAGFSTYSKFTTNYREIIGAQLSQPLTIGAQYYVSFYISNGYKPGGGVGTGMSTNKLGVRFSMNSYQQSNPVMINNFAHVFSDTIYADTTGWRNVSGFFIADSSYQYIGVGNFFTDSVTSAVGYDSVLNVSASYYYIDDVLVMDSLRTNLVENGTSIPIRVFPNFFKDYLIIDGKFLKSIAIYEMTGRKCIEKSCNDTRQLINTLNLKNGMYLIMVTTRDGTITQKVVKH